MTADDRLPWFPCEPTKLLNALAQMAPPEGYVYVIVLLRIYEAGGPCPDELSALCKRTGYSRRVVSDALDKLFRAGRLLRVPAGIMNPVAERTLARSRSLRGERIRAGQEGARSRWEKDKEKQTPNDGKAMPLPMATDAHLHLQLQVQKKERKKVSVRASARHPLAQEWTTSEADLAYATKRGFVGAQMESIKTAFSNFHWARGSLMADWAAAWRTWVENEIKFQRNRGGSNGNEGTRGGRQEGLDLGYGAIAARVRSRSGQD